MNNARLKRLFEESKQEVESIGIKLKKGITIKIATRQCKRYGVCKHKKNIEVSGWIFNLDDKQIKNTIIHEILHTLDDTRGHNYKWKWYASKVNKELGYDIARLGSTKNDFAKLGLEDKRAELCGYKYEIVCDGCGITSYRNRLSEHQRKLHNNGCYTCRHCKGTSFTIKDLR